MEKYQDSSVAEKVAYKEFHFESHGTLNQINRSITWYTLLLLTALMIILCILRTGQNFDLE